MQTLSFSDTLQKKVVDIDDLRRQLPSVLKRLPKEGELVIMQRGKPRGVLVDIASYLEWEELQEQKADSDPKLVRSLNKALAEAKAGKKIPADKVFKDLGI